eukprot:TRINITY_DN2406_c3_g2_i3.p1 TRINITY_DN2406_c3_g2~~TRINITY_DN2406_c3_g2_i3.p1  ORF type:complete len:268 (-),score=41.90 TRINITY_DN2406_c3_g2_i3:428-1231(-)
MQCVSLNIHFCGAHMSGTPRGKSVAEILEQQKQQVAALNKLSEQMSELKAEMSELKAEMANKFTSLEGKLDRQVEATVRYSIAHQHGHDYAQAYNLRCASDLEEYVKAVLRPACLTEWRVQDEHIQAAAGRCNGDPFRALLWEADKVSRHALGLPSVWGAVPKEIEINIGGQISVTPGSPNNAIYMELGEVKSTLSPPAASKAHLQLVRALALLVLVFSCHGGVSFPFLRGTTYYRDGDSATPTRTRCAITVRGVEYDVFLPVARIT